MAGVHVHSGFQRPSHSSEEVFPYGALRCPLSAAASRMARSLAVFSARADASLDMADFAASSVLRVRSSRVRTEVVVRFSVISSSISTFVERRRIDLVAVKTVRLRKSGSSARVPYSLPSDHVGQEKLRLRGSTHAGDCSTISLSDGGVYG